MVGYGVDRETEMEYLFGSGVNWTRLKTIDQGWNGLTWNTNLPLTCMGEY